MTDTWRKGDEFEIFTFDCEEEEEIVYTEGDDEDGNVPNLPDPSPEIQRILHGGDDIQPQPPELLEEHNETAT